MGALTDKTQRHLMVPVSFTANGSCKAEIWEIWKDAKDGGINAENVEKEERTVTSNTTLVLPMLEMEDM